MREAYNSPLFYFATIYYFHITVTRYKKRPSNIYNMKKRFNHFVVVLVWNLSVVDKQSYSGTLEVKFPKRG